jgi:arsenate reductase
VAHVLFVCVRNAGRSQMSEALFREAVRGQHETSSAGTDPAERVHPEVAAVMRELGIELSGRKPQRLTDDLVEAADVVVTMGCGDACPALPGKRYVEWDLSDPEGRSADEVRAIRDDIAERVAGLVAHLNDLN